MIHYPFFQTRHIVEFQTLPNRFRGLSGEIQNYGISKSFYLHYIKDFGGREFQG